MSNQALQSYTQSQIDIARYNTLFKHINTDNSLLKSPLNYIGGKYKILKQILPLFPNNINTFVDLFAGGCNVGVNVNANNIYFNDNLSFLIEMYRDFLLQDINTVFNHIYSRINQYSLSLQNEIGYKQLREEYNINKNPLDLFVLIAYSFNHQIRFNNKHQFNNPFGKDRSSFNSMMQSNLVKFIQCIKKKNVSFICGNFCNFDFSKLNKNDFVYCDPPYLITTGSYNDGKRGFDGWAEKEELLLLNTLDNLDKNNIKFGLSNVLNHKGKSNTILKNWLQHNKKYHINYININYANSNYQIIDRNSDASTEILVTNYKPHEISECDLFNL